MTIMGKDFDFDAIRKERARKAASGGVDLETGINQISPDIAKLKIGQTAQVEIPDYKNTNAEGTPVGLRKFVMSITAKLNNLTPAGAPWAGRQYKVVSDGARYVYVQRGPDLTAPVVRNRRGGGRKPAGNTSVEDSGAKVTEHA
jgi:hypothetical protein